MPRDEALDRVAQKLGAIRDEHGPDALAGFGSAKCSNEEAYLFQKLVRAGWGTNNVDHCTRLCHASSVAALLEGIGSGAVTTTYGDVAKRGGRPDRGLQRQRPITPSPRASSSRRASAA